MHVGNSQNYQTIKVSRTKYCARHKIIEPNYTQSLPSGIWEFKLWIRLYVKLKPVVYRCCCVSDPELLKGQSHPTTRMLPAQLFSPPTETLWAGYESLCSQPFPACLPSCPPGFTVQDCLTFNVLFKVLILWSFSFTDGFLHRLTKDFLSSFLVEGRRSPRGDRLACSNDL